MDEDTVRRTCTSVSGRLRPAGKAGVVIYSLKDGIILRRYFQTLYVKDIFKSQTVFFNKVTFPMGKYLCRTLYDVTQEQPRQSLKIHDVI